MMRRSCELSGKKPGLQSQAAALGAIALLEKPFSAVQLIDAIESVNGSEETFGDSASG